eukprot:TRINITY_DN19997_c0_g1_i2.p2 TRINITY_DN19997_c0_g1~~TRINITY_DN19997_c0_g1_i2.p2  ORF type:complete len:384 (+),score=133.19 TRINITY_DN19997_c0_g1_i2:82-1152(+)
MGAMGGKEHRVLVAGATGVGKTALLRRLSGCEEAAKGPYVPTVGTAKVRVAHADARLGVSAQIEFLEVSGKSFSSRELFCTARPQLRRNFDTHGSAVLVVIDASERDPTRIDLSRALIRELAAAEELQDSTIVIVATKCDIWADEAARSPMAHLRFMPMQLRSPDAEAVELSGFEAAVEKKAATFWSKTRVRNPGGSDPASAAALLPCNRQGGSGALPAGPSAPWRDFNKGPVILDFPKAIPVGACRFSTTTGSAEYDPVRWVVDGSIDGSRWVLLSQQTADYATPLERGCPTPWHPSVGAMGRAELMETYRLAELIGCKWQLHCVSARTGRGAAELLRWLATTLAQGGSGTQARN